MARQGKSGKSTLRNDVFAELIAIERGSPALVPPAALVSRSTNKRLPKRPFAPGVSMPYFYAMASRRLVADLRASDNPFSELHTYQTHGKRVQSFIDSYRYTGKCRIA